MAPPESDQVDHTILNEGFGELPAGAISEEEVANATAGDSSPVGAGLLYLRRRRARGSLTPEAGLSQEALDSLAVTESANDAEDVEAHLLRVKHLRAFGAPNFVLKTGTTPLSQEQLDDLSTTCDEAEELAAEGCQTPRTEEDWLLLEKRLRTYGSLVEVNLCRVKRMRAFKGASAAEKFSQNIILTQEQLDSMSCYGEPDAALSPCGQEEWLFRKKRLRAFGDHLEPEYHDKLLQSTSPAPEDKPEALSQDALNELCVVGEELEDESREDELCKLKRLHAYVSHTAAADLAAQLSSARVKQAFAQAEGLTQGELDEVAVLEDTSAEQSPKEGPEVICSKLKRLRAFGGAQAAEQYQASLEALAKTATTSSPSSPPKLTVQFVDVDTPAAAASAKPNNKQSLLLPIGVPSTPTLLGRARSLSASPRRDGKEVEQEQVMTPHRGRRSALAP